MKEQFLEIFSHSIQHNNSPAQAIKKILKTTPSFIEKGITNEPKLWFVDKPKEGAPLEAKQVPLSTIEEKVGIKWSEEVLVDPESEKELKEISHHFLKCIPVISHQNRRNSLSEIYNKCIIRWFDEKIGWTLMLRAGEELKKGFFGIYSGEIIKCSNKQYKPSSYMEREYIMEAGAAMNCDRDNKEINYEVKIDARLIGNAMRFLAFLPDTEIMDNFLVNPRIKDNIAFENIEKGFAIWDGIITPAFYLKENIHAPNDHDLILGFSYSVDYLCKMNDFNITFCLLDKNDLTQLNLRDYKQKEISVELEGTNIVLNLPRVRIMAGKTNRDIRNWTEVSDEKTGKTLRYIVFLGQLYDALMKAGCDNVTKICVNPTIQEISNNQSISFFSASKGLIQKEQEYKIKDVSKPEPILNHSKIEEKGSQSPMRSSSSIP